MLVLPPPLRQKNGRYFLRFSSPSFCRTYQLYIFTLTLFLNATSSSAIVTWTAVERTNQKIPFNYHLFFVSSQSVRSVFSDWARLTTSTPMLEVEEIYFDSMTIHILLLLLKLLFSKFLHHSFFIPLLN